MTTYLYALPLRYMVESAKLMGADEETAKQEMKKALEFEIKLANATTAREFRRDPNNLYNPTTLDQFENLPGKTLLLSKT